MECLTGENQRTMLIIAPRREDEMIDARASFMECLTGENQTTMLITAPRPSALSISYGFEQDVTKKGNGKKILENLMTIVLRTAPLYGLKQDVRKEGEYNILDNQMAIVLLRTAPLDGLKQVFIDVREKGEDKMVLDNQTMLRTTPLCQDVTMKEEDQKVLENLKTELEAKYRKLYMLRLFWIETNFEMEKISFTRAMEKAWLANSISREKSLCLISLHSGEGNHHKKIEKVMEFNKKIKLVICLGLDGVLFGASNKRKCSSYEAYDQVEEELEELDNLMECNRDMVPPPEDREKFGNYCKKTCRRAHTFTQLESREEYLQSVIDSLRERETERKRTLTVNEIFGYMLLQDIANSTLRNTSRELLDSITLSSASVDGDEQDENIHVEFNDLLYKEHADAKLNFEKSLASKYDAFVMSAKSDCNNSNNEVEQIKQMLAIVEELLRDGHELVVMEKQKHSASVVERQYERELFKYCDDLSYYMRLGRCLNPLSEAEEDRLEEIRRLAHDVMAKAIRPLRKKCRKANVPDAHSRIGRARLPTWRNF